MDDTFFASNVLKFVSTIREILELSLANFDFKDTGEVTIAAPY